MSTKQDEDKLRAEIWDMQREIAELKAEISRLKTKLRECESSYTPPPITPFMDNMGRGNEPPFKGRWG